jgi:hypothetical protein
LGPRNFRRVLDLLLVPCSADTQTGRGHRTGDANLALAAHLRPEMEAFFALLIAAAVTETDNRFVGARLKRP